MAHFVAQGLADAATDKSNVGPLFKKYIEALFPFYADLHTPAEDKMRETMRKEVSKGVIEFAPINNNVLKKKVGEFHLPEDVSRSIRESRRKVRP